MMLSRSSKAAELIVEFQNSSKPTECGKAHPAEHGTKSIQTCHCEWISAHYKLPAGTYDRLATN